MITTIIKGMLSWGKGNSIEGRVVLVGILWVFYLYIMGLGLGSVAWDATTYLRSIAQVGIITSFSMKHLQ